MSKVDGVVEKKQKLVTLDIDWASDPGDPIQPVFKSVYDEKEKCFRVKQTGTINVYEIIQASSSSSDLAILQKRLFELGEIPCASADVRGGIDYSVYPENIHDLYRMKEKAEIGFNSLPEDLRSDIGSVDKFMNLALDGTMGKYAKEFYSKKAASVAAAAVPDGDK